MRNGPSQNAPFDSQSNPENYQFVQVPIGQSARSLADVDAIVVHISDVYAAGLTEQQIIARESSPRANELIRNMLGPIV
ncbi:hypothetical protein [Mycolicibacterium hodleri]|uniref:hypothetical protein n=1 Tax=Mycolicibacterium hodleri TaxID=49897 RepID=UPI001F3476AC|nr:hypothetical protein [Mycolicibacterium hodleri]